MSEQELFVILAEKISAISAVQLGLKQISMIESRLRKHLRSAGYQSIESYWQYFQANESKEIEKLISVLTTHHTFFFRESSQFDYLLAILPDYVKQMAIKRQSELVFLSAACSQGHEAYSLAMILHYHLKELACKIPWRIVGYDIDQDSVATAKAGVYRNEDLTRVPPKYLKDAWIKGQDNAAGYSKIRPEIAKNCHFEVQNLKNQRATEKNVYDFIFCRNVFIYFKPDDIQSIVNQMTPGLRDEGRFFIGISENLGGLSTQLEHLGSSIYQKKT